MKRWLFLFTILAALPCALPGPAAAAPTLDASFVRKMLGGVPGVPAEWAGIWTTVDSTYNCVGSLLSFSAGIDTLCTGQGYTPDEEELPTNFVCTGTSTATTFDITCTGSEELFPDCLATFTIRTHGTRTADSYFTVSEMILSTSGTGKGCDLFPGQCTQFNSHGTRTGPEPVAYCATPALEVTWGRVKSQYR